MSSPFPTLAVCLTYVYIVKVSVGRRSSHLTYKPLIGVTILWLQVLGPRLMENRKPMQLKNALIVYNLFQVIFSSWLFYEVSGSCPHNTGWSNKHRPSYIFTTFTLLFYSPLSAIFEHLHSISKNCSALFLFQMHPNHVLIFIIIIYLSSLLIFPPQYNPPPNIKHKK